MRLLAARLNMVTAPRADRWHRTPTPLLGGLAIAAATIIAASVSGARTPTEHAIIGAAALSLVLGLVDDKVTLGPTAKLVGSLVIGATVIYLFGRSGTRFPAAPLVVLAVLWFATVVHAINLLDNTDGLAAGVGAIAAGGLVLLLVELGVQGATVPLLSL